MASPLSSMYALVLPAGTHSPRRREVAVSIDHYLRAVAVDAPAESPSESVRAVRYVFSLDRVPGCEAAGVHALRSQLTSTWASLAGPPGGERLAINECGERRCGPREALLFDVVLPAAPSPVDGGSDSDADDGASTVSNDPFAGARVYVYHDRNPLSVCADGRFAAKRIGVGNSELPTLFTLERASIDSPPAEASAAEASEAEWETVSLSAAERRLTSHVVGTWENQRWAPMRGWNPSLDAPPAWSDISGRHVLPLGSFELGPAWRWESEWAADLSAGAPRADGWSYAKDFQQPHWGSKTMRSMVRRRRWVRYRQRPNGTKKKQRSGSSGSGAAAAASEEGGGGGGEGGGGGGATGSFDDGWSASASEPQHDKWGRAWRGSGSGSGGKTKAMEDDVRRTTHHALDEFYRRVGEPDKLVPGKIETLRRRYAGREGELVRGLWNKYGCVPEVDERAPAPPLPARLSVSSAVNEEALRGAVQQAGADLKSGVEGIGAFFQTLAARGRSTSANAERAQRGSGGAPLPSPPSRARGSSLSSFLRGRSRSSGSSPAKGGKARRGRGGGASAKTIARMQTLLRELDEGIGENLARCTPPTASDVVNAGAKLQRSEQCSARGEHVDALELINEALALDPRNPRAYLGRSEARLRLGSRAAALSDVHVCLDQLRAPRAELAPMLAAAQQQAAAAAAATVSTSTSTAEIASPRLTALPMGDESNGTTTFAVPVSATVSPTPEAQLIVAAERQKSAVLAALGLAMRAA